ncbi:PspC domain-containing protein [Calidifontibacter terrae]
MTQQTLPPQQDSPGDAAHDNPFDRILGALRDPGLPRRADDKWIGGVCAGIAQRLGVDPLIVRAGFIVLGLVFGAGLSLYLVAWLLLPDRDDTILLERAARHGEGGPIALLIATIVVTTSGFGWLWNGGWGGTPLIPMAVIAVCVWAYVSTRTGQPAGVPSFGGTSEGRERTEPMPAGGATAYKPTLATTVRNLTQPSPPRPRRRPLGAALSWALLGLAAAVGGITALVLQQTSHQDVAARVGIAAALGVVGAGVLAAGITGRKAGGVSFVGWLLAFVTAVLVMLPHDLTLNGASGRETWTPAAATSQPYELSAGDGRLDLTRVTAPTGQVTVPAKVSFGHLTVVVPAGVPVEIRGHVDFGSIDVDSAIEKEIGWSSRSGGHDLNRTVRLGDQPATLVVDARVGFGAITIERKSAR